MDTYKKENIQEDIRILERNICLTQSEGFNPEYEQSCDEDKKWLDWAIAAEIGRSFKEKERKEIGEVLEESYAKQFETYIPDEVETGILKR